jgi:hypothetical protein
VKSATVTAPVSSWIRTWRSGVNDRAANRGTT